MFSLLEELKLESEDIVIIILKEGCRGINK